MKADYGRFQEKNAVVVVVAPHPAKAVREYFEKEKLPFPGIPDPDEAIGKQYGQQWHLLKLGRMPALFVIDTGQTIRFAHYSSSMADIPDNRTVLDHIPV